jgi:hypothetical protein
MGKAENFPLFSQLFLLFLSHLGGKHFGVAFRHIRELSSNICLALGLGLPSRPKGKSKYA